MGAASSTIVMVVILKESRGLGALRTWSLRCFSQLIGSCKSIYKAVWVHAHAMLYTCTCTNVTCHKWEVGANVGILPVSCFQSSKTGVYWSAFHHQWTSIFRHLRTLQCWLKCLLDPTKCKLKDGTSTRDNSITVCRIHDWFYYYRVLYRNYYSPGNALYVIFSIG